jgi:hypothetical protein
MRFPDLHQQQDTQRPTAEPDPNNADREPGGPQPATTAAEPNQQPAAWPVPGWQWASLVAVLLGGQMTLLMLTVWTLAIRASHGWPIPIILCLCLGLLARLVPDALSLAAWAATVQTWTTGGPALHLGIAIVALVLAILVAIAT